MVKIEDNSGRNGPNQAQVELESMRQRVRFLEEQNRKAGQEIQTLRNANTNSSSASIPLFGMGFQSTLPPPPPFSSVATSFQNMLPPPPSHSSMAASFPQSSLPPPPPFSSMATSFPQSTLPHPPPNNSVAERTYMSVPFSQPSNGPFMGYTNVSVPIPTTPMYTYVSAPYTVTHGENCDSSYRSVPFDDPVARRFKQLEEQNEKMLYQWMSSLQRVFKHHVTPGILYNYD